MRTIVYTAVYGDDAPSPIPDLGCECICFSDRYLSAPGWRCIVAQRKEWLPYRAKYWKLNPHEFLDAYDFSIWIDTDVLIDDKNFVREMCALLEDNQLAFFPHRSRASVKDEMEAHLGLAQYEGLPLREQVRAYFDAGFPDDVGLAESAVLPRYHNAAKAWRIDQMWWEENLRWGYADQLSLPFVLWRVGPGGWRYLPYSLETQPWFRIVSRRDDPAPLERTTQ